MEQNAPTLPSLNNQQNEALTLLKTWYKSPYKEKPFFYIAGYAGTGKSLLVSYFIEELGISFPSYGTLTGKAAVVLRANGVDANTIHSSIYIPHISDENKKEADKLRVEKKKYEKDGKDSAARACAKQIRHLLTPHWGINPVSKWNDADAIILDEVSMVDEQVAADVMGFKKPVIVLGDPGQLPPINGEGYFTKYKPEVFLTEIHRQEADNPIIKLSFLARSNGILPKGTYGSSKILHGATMPLIDRLRLMLSADQVITGRNTGRLKANSLIRTAKGFKTPYPSIDEKVICLKNDGDVGVFNGLLCIVKEVQETEFGVEMLVYSPDLNCNIPVDASKIYFDEYRTPGLVKKSTWYDFKGFQEFDFGYCLTVHKFQGSQDKSVLLLDDGFFKWDWALRKKWLYTAITRAQETFTLI